MILVDKPTRYPDKPHGYYVWSHMWSDGDDLEELHAFAKSIGLRREWFQPSQLLPHYDIVSTKYTMALVRGATICQDFAEYMHKRWKEQHPDHETVY